MPNDILQLVLESSDAFTQRAIKRWNRGEITVAEMLELLDEHESSRLRTP